MNSHSSARENLEQRLADHLQFVYPDLSGEALGELIAEIIAIMRFDDYIANPEPNHNPWTQQDAFIITYGDTIIAENKMSLRTLRDFLRENFTGYVSSVHVLPFFPWSSDDGFAVIDYLAVDESLGTWDEISAIAGDFSLMSDLVINHCSSQSVWFDNFKKRQNPGQDYFMVENPDAVLHDVVRPRVSPLLRATETSDGVRHVWCTFSHDQIDLDFHNTDVLLEFIRIVRFYLDRGVSIFRLDAVAFLWKDVGTKCINLPQTHELVRLFRTLIEFCDPEAIIITETNIPNIENLAYFGNANEAHVIYNFSLPPLLLYTLASGDCRALCAWLTSMPPAQNGTTYLNFIASHDGIGLRPAEGLLDDAQIDQLVNLMERFGGRTSWRSVGEATRRPYEINIALYDAFRGTIEGENETGGGADQLARFLCAHTIMFGLEGIPAIYIHSFFGTENDYDRVALSGHNRAINRHQWRLDELQAALADPEGHHGKVMAAMQALLEIRRRQPALHPNARQFILDLGEKVFGFWRQSVDCDQSIFCLHNISSEPQTIALEVINLIELDRWHNLLTGDHFPATRATLELAPYQSAWLANRPPAP